MPATAVDRLYDDCQEASRLLRESGEISLGNSLDENARKTLLLAAASFFESRITGDVMLFCREISGSNELVPAFVKNKAISRQYHTWFDWQRNTAGTFYVLFGADFKAHMEKKLEEDALLRDSIKNFMEVGRDRNRLVHDNYASFTLEKTVEEIYSLFKSASYFVDRVICELRKCSELPQLSLGDPIL